MTILRRWSRTLSACVVAAVCGCGAPSSSSSAKMLPAPAAVGRATAGWMSRDAKSAKALLYVANPFLAKIYVFSLHGLSYKLVGEISDSDAPDGMTTDAAGNLYVTDEGVATEGPAVGDIKVYPQGSTIYSRLIVPGKWVPFDAAVRTDGTMYVANIAPIAYFSPGSVSVYPPLASTPSRVLRLPNFQVLGVTLHRQTKTIYISYNASGGGGGKVAEFAHARGKAIDLGVSYPEPWGILEDGANNLLVCDGAGIVEVYSEATGNLVAQIPVPNGASWLAFNQHRTRLFVSNFEQVEILSYPGGAVLGSIDQPGWGKSAYPTGVAFWPPPE